MHVSSFSRCPSSASAEVTAVSGRFWQIVSSQRARKYSEWLGSSTKSCSTLFHCGSVFFDQGGNMRTHSYDASYQMIRDCVREIRPVRQDLFHRRHETESLRLFSPSRQRV